MSYEKEKTFSLNPCQGFHGRMEVEGKTVYLSCVEKSTRDGSKWLKVIADDLSFSFTLNDSKYGEKAYFGSVDINGETVKLRAAQREGSNGMFISGWPQQDIAVTNAPPMTGPDVKSIIDAELDKDVPF